MIKKLFMIVTFLILLTAVPASVFLISQRQELRKRATPATTLSFLPASISTKVNDTFSLEAVIDTGTNPVVVAEIHISFDATKLEALSVTNEPLLPNVLVSGTVGEGEASITVGAESVEKPVSGKGTVLLITFKALEKTDAPVSISFTDATFVGSIEEGATNALIGKTKASVTIASQEKTSQSTLSVTPTGIVSPTPTSYENLETPSPEFGQEQSTHGYGNGNEEISLSITYPHDNENIIELRPQIRGTTAPGAEVTITIYSNPQTAVVVADSKGSWSYTPIEPLTLGSHTIVATARNSSTSTPVTISRTIVIATPSGIGGSENLPVSGNLSLTYLMSFIGILCVLTGIILPNILKKDTFII